MKMVTKLAKTFVERAKTLGYKGKKADAAALDYFCGACVALNEANHPEAKHVETCAVLIVATRGMFGVNELANAEEKEVAEA